MKLDVIDEVAFSLVPTRGRWVSDDIELPIGFIAGFFVCFIPR